jgi:uncharacterized membrane protein
MSHRKGITKSPYSLEQYLFSHAAYWFWITIFIVAATIITIFAISEDSPLVYLRYVLSFVFVLWMPGYTFLRALFPAYISAKASSENLHTEELIAFGFGMSLGLVMIVGMLLNYTPLGIQLTPVALSLLALTLVFALVAMLREYQQ